MDKQSNYILEDLPKQKLGRSKKTKKWGKSCIDELEKVTYSDISYNGRSSRHRKQINYDLYNGTLDQKDFEYVINPYGYNKDEFPASLQHYDIISPKIQLLMGEEIKRPFNFKVITHDPDAISEMEKKKKEMMLQFLYNMIIPKEEQQRMAEEKAKMEQVDPERAKMMEIPTPEQVEKYMKYDYQDIREMQGQSILEYLVKNQSIESKFNAGFGSRRRNILGR